MIWGEARNKGKSILEPPSETKQKRVTGKQPMTGKHMEEMHTWTYRHSCITPKIMQALLSYFTEIISIKFNDHNNNHHNSSTVSSSSLFLWAWFPHRAMMWQTISAYPGCTKSCSLKYCLKEHEKMTHDLIVDECTKFFSSPFDCGVHAFQTNIQLLSHCDKVHQEQLGMFIS